MSGLPLAHFLLSIVKFWQCYSRCSGNSPAIIEYLHLHIFLRYIGYAIASPLAFVALADGLEPRLSTANAAGKYTVHDVVLHEGNLSVLHTQSHEIAYTVQMFSRTSKFASQRLNQLVSHLLPQTRTMSTLNTKLPLNTGAEIRKFGQLAIQMMRTHVSILAAVGFGTWQDAGAQEEAVLHALKAGYRHIDTARIYGTEPAVGKAIKKSGIPRSEIFVTTKLWNNSHSPEDVEPAIDASLKDLGMDYLDLYLMHWPSPFKSGDSMFPKNAEGKVETGDADFVEVCSRTACWKLGVLTILRLIKRWRNA